MKEINKKESVYLKDYDVYVEPYLSYSQIQQICNSCKGLESWVERQQNIDMLILFYSTNLTKEQIEGIDSDLFKQSGLINEVKKNILNLPELLEAIDYTFSIQKSFNQLLKEFPIVYQKTLEDMKKNGKLTEK